MPIYFRPSDFQPAGGDAAGPGGLELPGAGVSAGVESQLASPADVNQAHRFFQPSFEVASVSAPAAVPGAEAAAFSPMPGAEPAAMAAAPGADPVSPLIQLIMKLPGMGAITSFFDALAALFMPGAHSFDLTTLGAHAQGAVASLGSGLGEHLPISLSLLPADAPILQSLGLGAGHGLKGLFHMPGHLGSTLSEHSLGSFSREALNVSGQLDLNKAQFELGSAAGRASSRLSHLAGQADMSHPITSGPAISEGAIGAHLAGVQRLFSDRMSIGGVGSPLATGGSPGGIGVSQSLPLSSSSWPSSMQVGSSTFGAEAGAIRTAATGSDGIISGPSLSQGVGAHLGAPGRAALDNGLNLGPSGAVSDKLGGKQLLASDSIPTYRPTFGNPGSTDVSSTASAGSQAQAGDLKGASTTLKGLKAKQLSLKSLNSPEKAALHHGRPVVDHIAHQSRAGSAQAAAKTGPVMDQVAHKPAAHKPTFSNPSRQASAPEAKTAGTAAARPEQQLAQAATGGQEAVTAGSDAQLTSYTIRPGDCLWDIAREKLGTGLRWSEIYKLNAGALGSNPALIHPGTTIRLPGAGSEIASAAGEAGKYVVQPGDNLWDIANQHLGGGQNWGELYKANAEAIGSNPRLIHPGQELTLPGAETTPVASSAPAVDPSPAPAPSAPQAAAPQPDALPAADSQLMRQAHPVVPASSVQPSVLPPAGAAQAQAVPGSTQSSGSIVSSSLRPDLSFLNRKAR